MAVSDLANHLPPMERRPGKCEKHGDFIDIRVTIQGRQLDWAGCLQCANERAAHQAAEERIRNNPELRMQDLERRMGRSRIQPRYMAKSFENYRADSEGRRRALAASQAYARDFEKKLMTGSCMVFLGKPGTGKTHLAAAVAREISHRRHTALYVTTLDYIRIVREAWAPDSGKRELETIRQFVDPELLILDDVGVQHGSDAEIVQVTDLLDKRYCELRPTLLISNGTSDDLQRALGDRAYDRIRDNDCTKVLFDWESHRGKDGKSLAAGD